MRGLAANSVRPRFQHIHHHLSPSTIRRTTFQPLQRSLTCADAFLFFLPSVLTAALVIDYTGKERRRAEWDREIAAAQEEAEQLKQRQLESWSRIQRRSVSHGAWQQRRSLYTASQSLSFLDQETATEMDPLGRQDEINAVDLEPRSDLTQHDSQFIDLCIRKQERFSRLVATRLALELMLVLRRGRSARYKPQVTIDTTNHAYHTSMDFILQELDKVNELIHTLEIQEVPWDIKMPKEFHEKQDQLAARLSELTRQYKEVQIHLPDYIMSYIQLITEFKVGPSNSSYVEMMRVFSYHQAESQMAKEVEKALVESHLFLDTYTISNMLAHYGITFDSMKFNHFLLRLTRADHHPRPRTPWFRMHVNDMDVCVPKTKDGHVLTALIRTSLQCRQDKLAETYAMVFELRDRVERYSGIHKWFIVSCFLQSYGNWTSWNAGRKWLRTVLTWASDLIASGEWVFGRAVLRMLDFCVACGKHEEYEAIMRAVIAAEIQMPPINTEQKVKFSERIVAIRKDWQSRLDTSGVHFRHLSQPPAKKVQMFTSMLEGRWTSEPELKQIEEGPISYHPLGVERLKTAIRQRQEIVNHGFKGFAERSYTPSTLPSPPEAQETTIQGTPHKDQTARLLDPHREDENADEFDSPFFQPTQQYSPPAERSKANTSSDPTDTEPELARLQRELEETKRQWNEAKQRKTQEMEDMRQELEFARARLKMMDETRRGEVETEEEPLAKRSATG